ncbi:MAG: DUF4214 domain-containing protein [Paludisphaera borealis]|uniref:DUF4214 domain-containing protein n=1 Tax=Paludisphaera borealis TaxID=1387353 RepID=UPI00284498E3|nr:DUF4214 domain-containing protein [Paludisphaera borealis]MDR3621985.1 DUF4214 domain-containing protein [Paludisphaera borealis]
MDRRRRLVLEPLEPRLVLSATISGSVFQTFDASGLYPSPVSPSSTIPASAFLNLVGGVVVTLDGSTTVSTGTSGSGLGLYQFTNVAPGSHTITIQPPSGFLGFSGQSLSDTLVVQADQTSYANLNFAVTPTTAAVVQNLYQLVLNRSVGADELNQQVLALRGGKTTIGGVFSGLYNSAEFEATSEPVAQVIESFFPGPLDVGALRNAVQLQKLGVSQDAVVTQILYSPKFVQAFGDLSKLSNSSYVTVVYQNVLGRAPKSSELTSWDAQLAAGLPRADVALNLVQTREYQIRGRSDASQTAVSLAFVGVLGRQASPKEQAYWVARLQAGVSVANMANALAATAEFKNLKGFTDSLVWDVNAHQIASPVNNLDRLEQFDRTTRQFDLPVAAGSITSTSADPSNVYFLVHGWAPGLTQPVLLASTPGNPLKWWSSTDTGWLLNGVTNVSTEGLAQSIIDADPNAKVYAYSWIDQSDTPSSLNPSQTAVNAYLRKGRSVVQVSDVSKLLPGMTVLGPGIPASTYTTKINAAKNQITLSASPTALDPTATLTVLTSQFTTPGTLTAGSAVVSGIATRYLTAGMTATGGGIPAGVSIASIDTSGQLTLSQNAVTSGTSPLTFTGFGTVIQTQQGTLKNGFLSITGLDTSGLSTGMTVVGSNGAALGSIVSIDSSSQVTMSQSATSTGAQALIFKGADLNLLMEQNLYVGQSESYTQTNGLRLAAAIQQALAPGFFTYGESTGGGLIHILGHSHGSKVATVATLALQQANVPVAQLTTLESPEAGPQLTEAGLTINTHLPNLGGGENFLWYYMRQMNLSRTPVTGSRGSTNSTFVDNYFSTEGFGTALGAFTGLNAFGSNTKNNSLSSVVDAQMHPEILYGGVDISNPATAYPTLIGSHDYPPAWYGQASLRKAPDQPNGLGWSPLVNPVTVPTGDLYQQQTSTARNSVTLTAGSAIVPNIDTTGLYVGMPVSDDALIFHSIPSGTTIASIDPVHNSVTLSAKAKYSDTYNLTFQFNIPAYVANQYTLLPPTTPRSVTPTGPTPLSYSQQYTTGQVADTGSSITLTVDAGHSQAIDSIGFNPVAAQGIANLGAGMDMQVQFSGVPAGADVQLVVWIRGLLAAPQVLGTSLGSTLGYASIPLLTLDSSDVGSSVQYATLSVGQYLNSWLLRAPFNALNSSTAAAGTMVPTIAFSLIGDVTSTVSATVSNIRQFTDNA